MTLSLASRTEIAPGVAMPLLGFGTYKSAEGREVHDAVRGALEVGYRGFDTASMYGNEEGVGRALRESGIPRDDLFVATKVWNDEQGYEPTLAACERSLRRLGLEYVDLYLVHWPVREHFETTWRAMEALLAAGSALAIGVCNFLPSHLDALSAFADTPPAVDQVEHHPRLQRPELKAYCDEHGITLQAWAPIMRGHAPEVPELVAIAQAHSKSPEQVCLRWILQDGVTAIPKSVHRARIEANADVFDFELDANEMRIIASLDQGERFGRDPATYAW
jgi:methylglyoxal/glyoxal reductase